MIQYETAYRQGEILIFKVKKMPNFYGNKRIIKNGVIREGEKEGHEHKVDKKGQLSLFDDGNTGTLKVDKGGTVLTHPEHEDIKLPEGEYVVKVQKEATGQNTHASVSD